MPPKRKSSPAESGTGTPKRATSPYPQAGGKAVGLQASGTPPATGSIGAPSSSTEEGAVQG